MAVIIIPVQIEVEITGRSGEVLGCLTNPHNLQSFLTTQTGNCFKVALERTGRNIVLLRKLLN